MQLIVDPEHFPSDELFHTVTIQSLDNGDYHVAATSNDVCCCTNVGSVAIDGTSVGIGDGDVRFDAAGRAMTLRYADFEQYGYDEIQINFEERSREA